VAELADALDHRCVNFISDALAFGRLMIVDFQTENDEGDLADMARGMLKHSNFTKAEQRLILENYFRYDLRGIGGEKFLAIARKKVREHKADLLWFDALQNYLGRERSRRRKASGDCACRESGRGRGANRGGIRGEIRVVRAHKTRPCCGVKALASTDQ